MANSVLGKYERLQVFVELACYRQLGDVVGVDSYFTDASHLSNIRRAEKWFAGELGFLAKRDQQELREVWDNAINDGGTTRELFSIVKSLQNKYKEKDG